MKSLYAYLSLSLSVCFIRIYTDTHTYTPVCCFLLCCLFHSFIHSLHFFRVSSNDDHQIIFQCKYALSVFIFFAFYYIYIFLWWFVLLVPLCFSFLALVIQSFLFSNHFLIFHSDVVARFFFLCVSNAFSVECRITSFIYCMQFQRNIWFAHMDAKLNSSIWSESSFSSPTSLCCFSSFFPFPIWNYDVWLCVRIIMKRWNFDSLEHLIPLRRLSGGYFSDLSVLRSTM